MSQTYKTSAKGIALLKRSESIHDGDLSQIGLQPKQCPAGVWTIGWGHAIVVNGKFLKGRENKAVAYAMFPGLTFDEAETWLRKDLIPIENQINKLELPINQNQFDAIVDFTYNLGIGSFLESTFKKRIIAGSGDITEALSRWNKADTNGDGILEVLPGLTIRRAAEAKLYLS